MVTVKKREGTLFKRLGELRRGRGRALASRLSPLRPFTVLSSSGSGSRFILLLVGMLLVVPKPDHDSQIIVSIQSMAFKQRGLRRCCSKHRLLCISTFLVSGVAGEDRTTVETVRHLEVFLQSMQNDLLFVHQDSWTRMEGEDAEPRCCSSWVNI